MPHDDNDDGSFSGLVDTRNRPVISSVYACRRFIVLLSSYSVVSIAVAYLAEQPVSWCVSRPPQKKPVRRLYSVVPRRLFTASLVRPIAVLSTATQLVPVTTAKTKATIILTDDAGACHYPIYETPNGRGVRNLAVLLSGRHGDHEEVTQNLLLGLWRWKICTYVAHV